MYINLYSLKKMNGKNRYLPTKKIQELPLNNYYRIYKYKRLNGIYGESLLVFLYDYDTKEKFLTFLPKRFNDRIKDDDENSGDEGEDFPRTLGFLTQYDIAYKGETKLGTNIKRYEVDFIKSDAIFFDVMTD